MKQSKLMWLVGVALMLFLVACGPSAEPGGGSEMSAPNEPALGAPSRPEAVLSAETGAIQGTIEGVPAEEGWFVYLAWIQRMENEGYFYFLDTAQTPIGDLQSDGFFLMDGLAPREYAVLIGRTHEGAVPIVNADNDAAVFEVLPNQVLDIGNQFIVLPIDTTLDDVPPAGDDAYPGEEVIFPTPTSPYP